MSKGDLKSSLEESGWQMEVTVRRYLSGFLDVLEEQLEERSDAAVGKLSFNPANLGDGERTVKYGRIAQFLSEELDYVHNFTNYSIEPENIRELRNEAEKIDLYPTTEEEREIIQSILEDGGKEVDEIKMCLEDRVNYEPTDSMIEQRLEKIESVRSNNGTYKLNE